MHAMFIESSGHDMVVARSLGGVIPAQAGIQCLCK